MCKDIKCKYCNSSKVVKNGTQMNKQRYKCRECNKTFILEKDNRIKHSIEERRLCLTLYLNGATMKGIQKVINTQFNTKIHIQNIVHWIKNANKILEEELRDKSYELNKKGLVIMEMDELFTFIKKTQKF